jgi:hypothetical protein
MSLRATFQAWINTLINDDGTGNTGTLWDKTEITTQMQVIDDAIVNTGGTISTNTTYYVSQATGNDTTGDGSALLPWKTIDKALEVLTPFRVLPGIELTIQCDDGTYGSTDPISTYPSGVKIKGKNVYTKTMSSIQSSAGAPGNYTVVLNLDSVTDITTSDYAIIGGATGGTNPEYIRGVFDITNVDVANTRITVASTNYKGVPSGAVSGSVAIIKFITSFVGVSGIVSLSDKKISLENCVIKGDNTAGTFGLFAQQQGIIVADTLCGVYNFGARGVLCQGNGVIDATSLMVSGNGGQGISAQGQGRIIAETAVVSGNADNGFDATHHASILADSGVSVGNNSNGVFASFNAEINGKSLLIKGNTTSGINCTQQATIEAESSVSNNNGIYGIYAEKYGYVHAISSSQSGNGTAATSPAVNTQGNEFGYIDT